MGRSAGAGGQRPFPVPTSGGAASGTSAGSCGPLWSTLMRRRPRLKARRLAQRRRLMPAAQVDGGACGGRTEGPIPRAEARRRSRVRLGPGTWEAGERRRTVEREALVGCPCPDRTVGPHRRGKNQRWMDEKMEHLTGGAQAIIKVSWEKSLSKC